MRPAETSGGWRADAPVTVSKGKDVRQQQGTSTGTHSAKTFRTGNVPRCRCGETLAPNEAGPQCAICRMHESIARGEQQRARAMAALRGTGKRRELSRCRQEIAGAKAYLRDGGKDIEGARLAIHDWSIEEQLIRAEFAALRRGCGR